ncbi:MAG TPA: MBL fold metallo-hydrolase [Fibrobacteres bacterium]|jgi:hydroxyacylglutathione hydrolase|nr:MBL fold metallo-hydrolase [Fibrobacterota bacterium]
MTIEIKKFVTGPIETNTYIVFNDKKNCLVVDPSSGCSDVLVYIEKNELVPTDIILTHGHFDHVIGIPEVLEKYPDLNVWLHPADRIIISNADYNGSLLIRRNYTYDGPVRDLVEGNMTIGNFNCRVIHLPGHTPGGCAIIIEDCCLSGDSLFAGSIGRSDFGYGDGDLLIKVLKEKMLSLPDDMTVYPGHGNRTSIGREKRMNPFLQR